MAKLKNTRKMVQYMLETEPETRDDDLLLMLRIRDRFYYIKPLVIWNKTYLNIEVNEMKQLPNKDDIKRIRARFNQLWLYISEKPAVRKLRKMNEEKYKKFLQYA